MCSLHAALKTINTRIYQGKDLESDQLKLQNKIFQLEQTVWEKDTADSLQWIEHEGKCLPEYLHLEDQQNISTRIDSICKVSGELASEDETISSKKIL